jgi:TorA maturation chaperone TorD
MSDEKLPPGEQDLWRANIYHLLTRLLARPPSQRLLAQLSEIPPLRPDGAENPVALAWGGLGEASRRAEEPAVFAEFRALFGGEPGALIPHASWYLAGQLNAKPLALLRAELAGLGLGREADGPPEDHAGALCDTMGLLIETEDPRQIGFFTRHLKPWLPAFFGDVRGFPAADFYRSVGLLGEAFIEIESGYLRKIY